MKLELKFIGGRVVETKEEERNGVPVGIISGYIATWDIDRGAWGIKDQFLRGAFTESLNQLRVQSRPIRFKYGHNTLIGGFPIDEVKEDEVGLFGIGEVNLETATGREVMSLARQGILSEFSIGFSVDEFNEDNGLRRITKATIWEGSIVEEPMNPQAKVTEVKEFFKSSDVKDWGPREIEKALRGSGVFSKSAAKLLAGRLKVDIDPEPVDNVSTKQLYF